MKFQKCAHCGKPTAEYMPIRPKCMKAAGAPPEDVNVAEELRDIAQVLSITADSDANIRDALTGILNIADRLERGK